MNSTHTLLFNYCCKNSGITLLSVSILHQKYYIQARSPFHFMATVEGRSNVLIHSVWLKNKEMCMTHFYKSLLYLHTAFGKTRDPLLVVENYDAHHSQPQ